MSSAEERARQLYDEGARLHDELWDDEASMVRAADYPQFHAPRGTLAYAQVLLRSGTAADIERASRSTRAVLEMQERHEDHAHYGNFRWYLEHETVGDLNAVEFMLDGLNALIREPNLPPDLADEVRDAIEIGLDEIDRLDVHLSYTNIALSDISNSILGGEAIGDSEFVERGHQRLEDWLAFTAASGAPHEYNSPTYMAVDLARLAVLAEGTEDPDIALKARIGEELLWLHTAAHYHPQLAQLAGPHSRSYFDGWTGAGGYLKLMLWRILGDDNLRRTPAAYVPRSREEGHIGASLEALHPPEYIERWLREKQFPFASAETTDPVRGLDISTYMTETYALGAASRSFTVGEIPEQWEQPNHMQLFFRRAEAPGFGSMICRYVIDEQGLGAGSDQAGLEWNDNGTFVGAQSRNRAIVAYGLRARLRPTTSYKLSINILGAAGGDVRIGDRSFTDERSDVAPGEAVCISAGDAYMAIIPLDPTDMGANAPLRLQRDGERLTLDIYNYLGPAKQFWEHRSQSGPFYLGNIRNAAIVEVAERGEYSGLDAFAEHIATAMVSDSVDQDRMREIAYASEGGSVSLRYSLLDMAPEGRALNGLAYTSPMARAGALDGRGPQLIASRDGLTQAGPTKLLAGTSPKWLIADEDAGHFVFIKPVSDEAPVWLETAATVVECDSFGLGRIELAERAGTVLIEAAGEIGAVRVRSGSSMRLSLNGLDITDRLVRIGDDTVEFAGL